MAKIRVGDAAPEIDADAHDGTRVRVADFRGRWLVVYFYPRSFTTGCIVQVKKFRDRHDEIRALGADIVGVSIDALETQCRFAEHYEAGFPLVADADGAITRRWGVKRPLLEMASRVTFVVDPNGRVAARFHHELLAGKHVADVIAFLQGAKG